MTTDRFMVARAWAVALVCVALQACHDDPTAPLAASALPPAPSSSPGLAARPPRLRVPRSSSWPQTNFAQMKLSYRMPPTLVPDAPAMISGAQAGKQGEQVWGMSVKTSTGLDLVLLELKTTSDERARWLADFKATAGAGEIVLDEPDAVLKRSRILGKKADDASPALSTTHLDLRACKQIAEVAYCFDIDGAVELALARPGINLDEASDLIAMVRSVERSAPAKR